MTKVALFFLTVILTCASVAQAQCTAFSLPSRCSFTTGGVVSSSSTLSTPNNAAAEIGVMTFNQANCTATLVLYQNFNGSPFSISSPINGTYTVNSAGLGTVDFTASKGPIFAFAVASPNTANPPVETELHMLYVTPDVSTRPTIVSLVLSGRCQAQ